MLPVKGWEDPQTTNKSQLSKYKVMKQFYAATCLIWYNIIIYPAFQ